MTPICRLCIDAVLEYEGGYSADARDPGNWTGGKPGVGKLNGTNFGIAAASHPDLDIIGLTREVAEDIYANEYWPQVHGDELPPALAMATLDAFVMSGHRAITWLQSSVGAVMDGQIGPLTIGRANVCDQGLAVNALCDLRLAFLRDLDTWITFGHGWAHRVADVRARALRLVPPQ
jgi:lysozyme family protein